LGWLCSPRVSFCGYSIPHPSDAKVNIRVQTTGRSLIIPPLLSNATTYAYIIVRISPDFQDWIDSVMMRTIDNSIFMYFGFCEALVSQFQLPYGFQFGSFTFSGHV
jgi:hypothetical protein